MADMHKPGETVKTSGIYKVVKEGGGGPEFEVTLRRRRAFSAYPLGQRRAL